MQRKTYLDVLRICAAYAVVLLHTISKMIGGPLRNTLLVYDGTVRWAVPTFVMISGTIFLNPEMIVKTKTLIRKNVFGKLFILYFWTALYCLWDVIINGKGTGYVVQTMITGYWHLWFLHMIVGLYLITPLLRKIAADMEAIRYYLLIALLFSFVFSFAIVIFEHISFFDKNIIELVKSNYENLNVKFVLGYTPYFLLGYYLDKVFIPPKWRRGIYFLGLLGFLMNIFGNLWLSEEAIVPPFDEGIQVPVLLQCIGIFVFAKYNVSKYDSSILKLLSKFTFGVYLVHILIREVLDKFFHLNAATYRFVLWAPFLALVIFLVSMVVSAIINNIPVIKNYIA